MKISSAGKESEEANSSDLGFNVHLLQQNNKNNHPQV